MILMDTNWFNEITVCFTHCFCCYNDKLKRNYTQHVLKKTTTNVITCGWNGYIYHWQKLTQSSNHSHCHCNFYSLYQQLKRHCSLVHWFIGSLIHSDICSFVHSDICSFVHWFILTFVHYSLFIVIFFLSNTQNTHTKKHNYLITRQFCSIFLVNVRERKSFQPKYEMKRALLLNAVISEGAIILKLLTGKDKTLLIRRDALLIMNLCLHVAHRVSRLHIKSDGLACKSLHENLHVVAHVVSLRGWSSKYNRSDDCCKWTPWRKKRKKKKNFKKFVTNVSFKC